MSLIERLQKVEDAKVWYDDIPIENEYTVGIAGERFLRTLKEQGVIMGTVCPNCDLTYVPPSMYCERCFAELDEWVEVPSTGVVDTYTVLTRSLEGEPLGEPQVLALIRLEGAHGGLVHRLGEITPEEVEIGMAVQAVLKPANERQGSILDIEHFKPV
ncbi:MAG TPA: Zn-ribbon domain-containing OB-fold protein [Anaerolineae bacterium]|jgi:uncharacterized OB-fold protein|nr:Zn-ribbon domain-containing OB-fold protein [Anaerolineae bacterium]